MRHLIFSLSIALGLSACQTNDNTDSAEHSQIKPTMRIEIYDERAKQLLDADTPIDLLADGFIWTEGPLWVSDGQYLLFSDIPNNRIVKYQPDTQSHSVYLENSGWASETTLTGRGSNALLLTPQGQLMLMQTGERAVSVMDAPLSAPEANYQVLAAKFDGHKLNSPNDAVFHSNGDLYFTDPTHGLDDTPGREKELDFSGVYRLTSQGELSPVSKALTFPNGIALSLDEKTLYVAVSDSEHPAWYRFELQSSGRLSNQKTFYDAKHLLGQDGHQGMPDGIAIHSSGIIFATGPGGLWLFDAEGTVLARVFTGKLTANVEFGEDEKYVYLTAHQTLLGFKLK